MLRYSVGCLNIHQFLRKVISSDDHDSKKKRFLLPELDPRLLAKLFNYQRFQTGVNKSILSGRNAFMKRDAKQAAVQFRCSTITIYKTNEDCVKTAYHISARFKAQFFFHQTLFQLSVSPSHYAPIIATSNHKPPH